MKEITKKLTAAVVFGSALLLSAQQATASSFNTYQLTFDDLDAQGGTLEYSADTGGILEGTGILLDTIINDSNKQLKISGGSLDFDTGSLISYSEAEEKWVWSGDDSEFALTGKLVDGNNDVIFDGVIFSGTFGGPNITNPSLSDSIFSAAGVTTLSDPLINFMGIDLNKEDILGSYFTTTQISIDFTADADGYFDATNTNAQGVSTTVTMTISNSPVPSEGTTAIFLVLGVSCLGFLRSRFSSNS